jgi:hypothetical protein
MAVSFIILYKQVKINSDNYYFLTFLAPSFLPLVTLYGGR